MYIHGRNVAKEVLNNKGIINKAYVSKDFKASDLLNELKKITEIEYVDKRKLDQMAGGVHQGIVLSVPDFKYCEIDDILDNSILLILDHIEDPHNFGAIIRTAEAVGITGIIVPKNRSVLVNSTVMKTSVGTLEKVKIAKVINLNKTIDYLKEKGYWIVGTDMDGEDYTKIDYKGKIVIVVGNEGSGISKLVRENCDFIASIKMKGTVNSLNASVATGVILFEAVKQRG